MVPEDVVLFCSGVLHGVTHLRGRADFIFSVNNNNGFLGYAAN
ncbi:MAG TPA: hypothetical protein VHG09_04915 [Longimicrobiales bacterium]|nr:hypothetical protein [Longimicrobiales bacterium]